jgi:hypothetical protein
LHGDAQDLHGDAQDLHGDAQVVEGIAETLPFGCRTQPAYSVLPFPVRVMKEM